MRTILFSFILLSMAYGQVFAGVTSSGGVALNTHPTVCEFETSVDAPWNSKPIQVYVVGDITEPLSKLEVYELGVTGWTMIPGFQGIQVLRNYYRTAPMDNSNHSMAYRFSSYPLNSDSKRMDILMYSTDIDSEGKYSASFAIKDILFPGQDERFEGFCRLDVVFNQYL